MNNYSNLTDSVLVKSLVKGDIKAYDQLYRKYSKKLLYFALGFVDSSEDAEDIVQEVFLIVWRKHSELKIDSSFNSYLFTIAYNSIKKYYRKKGTIKKHLDLYLNDFTGIINDTNAKIEYNDLVSRLEKIVVTFPERRKEVFKLSRESHLSNQEIADKLGISKKTVENHITSSLKILRERLGLTLFLAICQILF